MTMLTFSSLLVCDDFDGLSHNIDVINALLGTVSLFKFLTREDAQIDFVFNERPFLYMNVQRLIPLIKSDHALVFCPARNSPPPPKITELQIRVKSPSLCAMCYVKTWRSRAVSISYPPWETSIKWYLYSWSFCYFFLFNKHFLIWTVQICSDDKLQMKPSIKHLLIKRDNAYTKGKRLKYLRLRSAVSQQIRKRRTTFSIVCCSNREGRIDLACH